MPVARSNYKQVRITLTEFLENREGTRRGQMLRVEVKPVEADWSVRDTILRETHHDTEPLLTLSDVYDALGIALGHAAFPRIDA